METVAKLFGSLLALVYHCFDRIVILGHLPLLTRPENIVHFFRDVHHVKTISKEVLRQRTKDYNRWVEAFAKKRNIPLEWAEKGVRKEDYVRPHLRRMERRQRFGVYFILQSMELGPSFRSAVPRFPVDDPHYRILARQRSRYRHYYFYIRDEVLGPMALCVGSFLPFSITYYLNGHSFMQRELERAGMAFRKDDNAFLWAADPQALQAAADRLSPQIIRQQLDHWTWVLGPRFSQKDRAAINLSRHYSLQQVEYCRNFVFHRNFPTHKLFERSCDLGTVSPLGRQALANVRLSPPQATAWPTHHGVGKGRTRPSRVPRLRQKCRVAHVREVLHLFAPGGPQQPFARFRTEKVPGQLRNRAADTGCRYRSFRCLRSSSSRCPCRFPTVPALGSPHSLRKP